MYLVDGDLEIDGTPLEVGQMAVLALDDLIGAVTPEDILDRVFAAFCVGK